MIYLNNNTETQAIYIPRQTVLGSGYIATTEKYEEGYNDGFKDGKEQQKDKLSSLHVAENGQYEREDGWNVVTVDVPDLNGSYDEGYAEGERVGYNQGKTDGVNEQKGKLESINITENGTYTKEDGYNHIEVNVPDLNGSYDEGYEQGHTEGYAEGERVGYEQGKTDGVNEQKGKLSQITISENGTYTKEDGYNEVVVNVPDLNGDYNEGYKQGQADLAAKARVLNVTENGVYKSKFSDPIPPTLVTGIYADGTKFHNYDELNGKVFNTKIAGSVNSRLEFWYKGDNTRNGDGWNVIIGSGNFDDTRCFQVRYFAFKNDRICAEGASRVIINGWDDTVWHHLIISETEGVWVDGEKKGDFSISDIINGEFFINGIGYDSDGGRTANGTFGMIKIDDVVIIPTADGFLNTNTGELLEVVKDGTYTFTENLPIYAEGELYKTINVNVPDLNGSYDEGYNQGHTEGYEQGKADVVANARDIEVTKNGQYGDGETLYKAINVNVVPKINPQKYGLRLGYSIFKEVPEWLDFNGITDMSNMFRDCRSIKTIPLLDTSNVINMSYMFYNCTSLQTIPLLNTSRVTNMANMFGYCKLQTIPLLNTSNVTDMNYMFFNCNDLQTIPPIDTSNVTNMEDMFFSCPALQTISPIDTSNVTNMSGMFYECSNLQTIPPLDTSKVTNMGEMFQKCRQLTSLPAFNAQSLNMPSYSGFFGYYDLPKLTDFGGLLNLKCSLANDYNLKRLPNLTYESCINVLNGLYDFTGNGEVPNSNQGQLKVHQNFLDKVGDEISIGVAKGWTITA